MLRFSLAMVFCLAFLGQTKGQISHAENQWRSDSINYQTEGTFQSKVDTFYFEEALLEVRSGDLKLGAIPVVDVLSGQDLTQEELANRFGFGAQLAADYRKWKFRALYLNLNADYLNYQNRYIDSKKVVPGMNVARGTSTINSDFIDAFVQYKSRRFFTFEAGYGRNFIGNGYRSLLLSDFGNAMPYFKLETSFWKIKYTNLFAMQQNIYGVEGRPSWFQRKYTATHFLDWQIVDWLSIGIFESIVWAGNEGNYQRGFDAQYLNPVIFYRPVEFSLGSSDNALLGANLKVTPSKTQKFYFQLLFDEFLLDELRADLNQYRNPDQDIQSGWWANKYGIQAGWQGANDFGIKGLSHLIEFNIVRPFTYAHTNPSQAYSNYNQSLAHPLGANFQELVSRIQYRKNRWAISLQYNNSLRGVSPVGTNFGDNLELSNQNREKEYENYIGQGISSRTQMADAKVSYLLKPKWNLTASLGYFWREEKSDFTHYKDQLIYLRLRTNLFNRYFDF
ncbi:MAG: hypothetical protein RIC95_15245 [Vicingaceae bacterium]